MYKLETTVYRDTVKNIPEERIYRALAKRFIDEIPIDDLKVFLNIVKIDPEDKDSVDQFKDKNIGFDDYVYSTLNKLRRERSWMIRMNS